MLLGTSLETLTTKKEDTVFKIIDRVLKQVFGEEATLFIYKYLEHHYSLRQCEFSEKIGTFAKGLEDCLSSGAFVIESKILDDVYSQYGSFQKIDFERTPEEYDFASKIRFAIQSS